MKQLTFYFLLSTFYFFQSASNWGGEHIGLELTEGGGSLEFDCAHGSLDAKIAPDGKGRFKVPGLYVEEHGGPVRAAGTGGEIKVFYAGQISGEVMKLAIRRRDNNRLIGSFTLVRSREPEIVKCK